MRPHQTWSTRTSGGVVAYAPHSVTPLGASLRLLEHLSRTTPALTLPSPLPVAELLTRPPQPAAPDFPL